MVTRFEFTALIQIRFWHNMAWWTWDTVISTPHPSVPHICVGELGQHWFSYWFVAYSAPSHYLNQCSLIVNCTTRNKLQWNSKQNSKLFIEENAFENVVCEMAAILSVGRWVNSLRPNDTYVCNLVIISSSNSLSPAITWNNVDLLSIGLLGTNFIEIPIKIPPSSVRKNLETVVIVFRSQCI